MRKFVRAVDTFNEYFGQGVALLILPLVFVVVYEVIARKVFHAPTMWAFETTVYLYGAFFMLGSAYTALHGRHVRIDILSSRLPKRFQTWVQIVTFILMFAPFVGGLSLAAVVYAANAWLVNEHSWSAWKPPLYLYKTVMPVGLILLFIQGLAQFIKEIYRLKGEEL